MRLFQAALDTPLDSPFSATLSVHGLHFTVCAPSKKVLSNPHLAPEKVLRNRTSVKGSSEPQAGFYRTFLRDGPNTTTTMIFQKSIASDAASKPRLMAHQMKNLCGFSVFHCVEGAFGAPSGGNPKMKSGEPRDELKNGCGRSWAVPYTFASNPPFFRLPF